MFPEHRELISELRQNNAHFAKIFDEHNALDHEIIRLEQDPVTSGLEDIEVLKKKKLHLKDEIYQMILKAKAE
ncbi:YdcH family protein [Moraxella sp. ZY210820]|uniref:YdcH family protein n=1 Tax=unclassified Moraxella TaxID=2685852 RepID=UPI0027320117|nr:YdcH family protein [Moraxella sp. ZY210820]WLF84293.1 YdcH family protein [Moraxella sp. ZY210820]